MTSSPSNPKPNQRRLYPQIDPRTGDTVFSPTLTPASRTDTVDLVVQTVHALPIVFVPGIMGSNLRSSDGRKTQVWRLDSNTELFNAMKKLEAGKRQNLLHPLRTEVDPEGAVPKAPTGILRSAEDYRTRGWGEVGAESYQAFLVWLEENLNGQRADGMDDGHHQRLDATLRAVSDGAAWGAQKAFDALTADESARAEPWAFPVYACGYNWLQSSDDSAGRLAERIRRVIADNNRGRGRCEQVIVVTHSLGGLVARRCSQLPGMAELIAGVVHGVMPTVGAAVAYRRCKVGLMDEGASGFGLDAAKAWGAAQVIGRSGQEVTAVFAQAPGALQLLPTAQYPARWLRLCDSEGNLLARQPDTVNPYASIYGERNRWWGLVKEEWLAPEGGKPIDWTTYMKAIKAAADFHELIKDHYHPTSWAFYGHGVPSFETLSWRLHLGTAPRLGVKEAPPSAEAVAEMPYAALRVDGTNPEHVPGPDVRRMQQGIRPVSYPTQHYDLTLQGPDASGDGTVPVASGRAPLPHVKQLFALRGIDHEGAFRVPAAQLVTAYSITRIAAAARVPQGKPAAAPPKARA